MKARRTLVIAAVVCVFFLVLFGVRIAQTRQKQAAAKAQVEKEVVPAVRVATATKKDLPQLVQITGSVKAQNEVPILPKLPGRVTKVMVEVGTVVRAGDVLATTESVDMALRVKQAEAQLLAAKAGWEQAKLQQATASRAFERAKNLREKGAMTQLDFEQAETGLALATVGVQAAEAQVALAEANLGLAQKAFDDTRITSPIAGVVTRKNVNVGTMANPGAPAFAVQDQASLKLEGSVPAAYVPRVKPGMKVAIVIDELPGRSFDGTVTRMAPTLDPETRRGAVEIAVQRADGVLPYMFARAEIAFGATENVVVVPSSAVQSLGGEPAVYLVRDGHAALARPRLGIRYQDDVVVEDGVAAGDQVIVSGAAGLKDGVRVTVSGG